MPLPNDFSVNKPQDGLVFEAIDSGVYKVTIKDIEDMGMIDDRYSDGQIHMLSFTFEVSSGKFKGFELRKWVANKWSQGGGTGHYRPSNLFVVVSAVLGKKTANPPEDLNTVIGKELKITVKKVTDDNDQEKNIITDFMEA